MSKDELPIGFATFLISGILQKLAEKDMLGRIYIRFGRVLTVSNWLYETGAILGRFWKDRVPIVVKMFEVESKQEQFLQYWRDQAQKRLDLYRSQPKTFTTLVFQTDMEMYTGEKLESLRKIGDKKLYNKEVNKWLQLAETSMIEGIMFGSMFPDLTHTMLVNRYEKIDMDSWKEARRYGVTLPDKPSQTTAADKEKEAIAMAHDYVAEYHTQLIQDLGLAKLG